MRKAWIEAMRLRTLPVSVAGVLAGCACAVMYGVFSWLPALICFLFAVVAQIVSNFANEYYDYANGLDRKGREGFRRGVTEGDITPRAMRRATYTLLILDCLLGSSLIYWGGWWLLPVGAVIALFALAYSTGPFPLSHHGLGDIAVVVFFGIVPVAFTAYVQAPDLPMWQTTVPIGAAVGLLAANVLIVNNYRDMEDDREVGKHTTVVIFGRKTMSAVYLLDFTVALILIGIFGTKTCNPVLWTGLAIFEAIYLRIWNRIRRSRGNALNPRLRDTAMAMLGVCIFLIIVTTLL